MKYTQIMRNNVKKELTYQYFSRVILITFVTILFFSVWNLYLQMKETQNNYQLFLKTKSEFVKDGIDINQALKQKANVQIKKSSGGGDVATIDNVLRYDYDNAATSIYVMQPKKSITITLEWMSFLFFPFVFTMYGIYIGTYDIRYKTIKLRAVQDKWGHILLSKQLSIYISTIIMVTLTLVFSYLCSNIFYSVIQHSIPIKQFNVQTNPENHNVFFQYLLAIFICLLFSTIGFYIGVLFKGFIAPALIFVVYDFIIPILGKYDPRNLIAILGHKVFSFQGRMKLFEPSHVPTSIVFLSLFLIIVLSTIIAYIISSKQNKYVV